MPAGQASAAAELPSPLPQITDWDATQPAAGAAGHSAAAADAATPGAASGAVGRGASAAGAQGLPAVPPGSSCPLSPDAHDSVYGVGYRMLKAGSWSEQSAAAPVQHE